MIQVCTGKLHRATVTGAELEYEGSVTICAQLMRTAHIQPFQLVHINNLRNAAHWETYAVPGESGELTLNGPPAHLFMPGDLVVVNAWRYVTELEAPHIWHRTLLLDDENRVARVKHRRLGS